MLFQGQEFSKADIQILLEFISLALASRYFQMTSRSTLHQEMFQECIIHPAYNSIDTTGLGDRTPWFLSNYATMVGNQPLQAPASHPPCPPNKDWVKLNNTCDMSL